MRRLVICLDGTWNTRNDTTNVWRIFTLTSDGEGSVSQIKYYDQGVGTRWYDKVTGGAFGAGMYSDVREAYTWLCEQYRPGDEIFLFGFSRGAATAVSLANLIDSCGIVGAATTYSFEDAYRLYCLQGFRRDGLASKRFRMNSEDFGLRSPIRFLGLFDTVASLFLRRLWKEDMHILTLPNSAYRVAHAIALDENRTMFRSVRFSSAPTRGTLSERWFSGAHANIGGGYACDPLARLPLQWMMREAEHCGLSFRKFPNPKPGCELDTEERDSFREFGNGFLMLFPPITRKSRSIGRNASGAADEVVDHSAISRFRRIASYRRNCRPLRTLLGSAPTEEGDLYVRRPAEPQHG
jgi:uncharacterized protein (DUF2235 family)